MIVVRTTVRPVLGGRTPHTRFTLVRTKENLFIRVKVMDMSSVSGIGCSR